MYSAMLPAYGERAARPSVRPARTRRSSLVHPPTRLAAFPRRPGGPARGSALALHGVGGAAQHDPQDRALASLRPRGRREPQLRIALGVEPGLGDLLPRLAGAYLQHDGRA